MALSISAANTSFWKSRSRKPSTNSAISAKKIEPQFFHKNFPGKRSLHLWRGDCPLFESLEGKRGEPRNKPPYPSISGFRNNPTVINNVETRWRIPIPSSNTAPRNFMTSAFNTQGDQNFFSVSGDTRQTGHLRTGIRHEFAGFRRRIRGW